MCIRKKTFPVPTEDIFQAAIDSIEKLKWKLIDKNPKSGEIKAMIGTSFKSWGEYVFIKIFPERTETAVTVTSKTESPAV